MSCSTVTPKTTIVALASSRCGRATLIDPRPRASSNGNIISAPKRNGWSRRDNTVSHNNRQWQILKQPQAPQPGSRVTLRTPLTGDPYWLWQDKPLRTKYLGKAVA